MNDKTRKIGIVIAAILGLIALLYVGGLIGQLLGNYQNWMEAGGMTDSVQIKGPNVSPIVCFMSAFSLNGLKGMGIVIAAVAGLILYIRFSGQDSSKGQDERGFKVSNTGTYGTAGWMSSKDMKEVFEITSADKAEGTILGEHKGKLICLPTDTKLNRHVAVFGASGTMKSRAVIRNMIFQSIRKLLS